MKSVPENNSVQTCSTSFPGAQNASFSTLNSLQTLLEVKNCSSKGFNPAEAVGKGQFVVDKIFDLRPVAFLKDLDLFVNGEAFGSYKMRMRLLFSCQVISNPLWPYGLQHSRLPCPSLFPILLKVISIKREMISNHLTLCHLLPPVFPSIGGLFQLIQLERDLGIVVNPGLEVGGQEENKDDYEGFRKGTEWMKQETRITELGSEIVRMVWYGLILKCLWDLQKSLRLLKTLQELRCKGWRQRL